MYLFTKSTDGTKMTKVNVLEPDILECEVKWALGSITMNKLEGMEFQLSSFKS